MEIDQVESLVYKYFKDHNIEGWKFKLGKGKRTLGMCDYGRKILTISKFHIKYSTKDKILDTIRHEVAHILAERAGDAGHGEVWQRYAIQLGAKPEKYQNTYIPHLYHVICGNCDKKVGAFHRKPRRDLSLFRHKHCGEDGILKLIRVRSKG